MASVSFVLVSCTIVLVGYIFRRMFRKPHPNYPAGPPALPLIGNVHQLTGMAPHLKLTQWAAEYGKIYSVKLGLDNAVVVNDPKLIRALLGNTAASGRIQNEVFLAMSLGKNHGIVNSEGTVWEEQRRFTLRKLRDAGFAKTSMEGMILDEVQGMLKFFQRMGTTPFQCNRLFNSAVVNSLWALVTGEKSTLEWDEKTGKMHKSELLQRSDQFMSGLNSSAETGLIFAPFLRHFAPDLTGWTELAKSSAGMHRLGKATVEGHWKTLDASNPRDLIDHILLEIERTEDLNSSFYQQEGVNNLMATLVDLFEAGNETTSNTLAWAFLYLAHHPTVQERLTEEIQAVIGDNRMPSIVDRPNMPYTEATILEVLRMSSLVPMGVLHRMLRDLDFHGYHLPKGTIIIPNLYACLHSPEIWGDPEHFRPERFLAEDGTKVLRNLEAFLPFSAGRRVCFGETLAKDTLFLFITSIFQKLQVCPGDEDENGCVLKPNFEPEVGFLNFPKPFKVTLREH